MREPGQVLRISVRPDHRHQEVDDAHGTNEDHDVKMPERSRANMSALSMKGMLAAAVMMMRTTFTWALT